LTPERWNQVKQLFQQALELDDGRRGVFLDQACRGDHTLRREVELLITAHSQATSFIETPVCEPGTNASAHEKNRLSAGQVLGHYRIVSLLGAGGVGEVYLAEDTRLKRKVAIKVLLPDSLEDRDRSRKRLVREAQAAARLDHPNICAIHEIGEQDNRIFIAMQYIEGETLADLIKRGPLDAKQALELASQVADALSEAHSRGITHRDIKPANIMVTSRGRVKVLDFGLAKLPPAREDIHSGTATQSQLTDPGTVIGTVAYMSPEQLRGEPIDSRTDIFSLGVSLYEMLSGQRPFEGPNNLMLMVDIVSGEPRPLAAVRPDLCTDLCPDLDRIISKALNKSPLDRYQTADEMKRDITQVISAEPITGKNSQTATARFSHGLKPFVSTRFLRLSLPRLAAVSFGLLAVGAAAWLLFRPGVRRDVDPLLSLKVVSLHDWKSELGESFPGRPAFSRDGKMIAFSTVRSGDRNIWIKQVAAGDNGEAYQVTHGKWNDYSPVWSPDSQSIAFVSNRGGQTGIWSTPAPWGGDLTLLKRLDVTNAISAPTLSCWSKNGETILYEFEYNLFGLDLGSRESRQITHFDISPVTKMFSISPGEDRIAYVDRQNGKINLWRTDFKQTTALQITDEELEADCPVWHPDGRRIIYRANRSGTYQIRAADVGDRTTRQIIAGDTDAAVSDVSADGTKILITSARDESDIWGAKIETGEEFEVTSETGVELWPTVSRDGHSIAFQATKTIMPSAFLGSWITTRGISEGQQTRLARDGFEPRWSPDGAKIAFLRVAPDLSTNIWTIPAVGGEEKQLTATGIYFGGYAQTPCDLSVNDYSWSPDGEAIVYCSPLSGQAAVWAISLDKGGRSKLSTDTDEDYYFSPLWSPDGVRISFLSKTKRQLAGQKQISRVWVNEIESNPHVIYQTESRVRLIGWRATPNEVLIASVDSNERYPNTPTNVTLSAISPNGRANRTFAKLESAYPYNIASSPDGKLIAFASRQDGKDNVWVVPSTGGTPRKVTANTDPLLYCSSLAWSPDGKAIYYGKQAKEHLISMIDNFK
jgi:serine/threonine protein kinase